MAAETAVVCETVSIDAAFLAEAGAVVSGFSVAAAGLIHFIRKRGGLTAMLKTCEEPAVSEADVENPQQDYQHEPPKRPSWFDSKRWRTPSNGSIATSEVSAPSCVTATDTSSSTS